METTCLCLRRPRNAEGGVVLWRYHIVNRKRRYSHKVNQKLTDMMLPVRALLISYILHNNSLRNVHHFRAVKCHDFN